MTNPGAPRASGRPTLKTVAAAAGVSRVVASLVLNGATTSARVSETTRARVAAAAERVGYVPCSSGVNLRSGRFGCAALVLSTEANRSSLLSGLLEGIHDGLMAHEMHLTVARLPDERLTDAAFVPKILKQWMSDGLIINYTAEIPRRMVELLRNSGLPSVWLNSVQPRDCVRPDDERAARSATERLIRLGHERIAFAVHRTSHYSAVDRRRGYERAMRAARLAPRVIRYELGARGWVARARALLSREGAPTAILAHSPFTAQPILHAALASGVAVPDRLSLATFADRAGEDGATGRHVTTWLLPESGMGRAAVEMLVKKIERPRRRLRSRVLGLTYVEGDTCGAPSRR